MGNIFLNLPPPVGNGVGAAVDVTAMGGSKTIIVGGTFQEGLVSIEYATDDAGTVFVPLQGAGFSAPGRLTTKVACRWMRVRVSGLKNGTVNVDVGSNDAGSTFVELVPASSGPGAAVDISELHSFKTVVVDGAFDKGLFIEVSEDGVAWSQAFAFYAEGGESALVYGQFARVNHAAGGSGTPSVWLGATAEAGDIPTPINPPFPDPAPIINRWYARPTGSDVTGDGTLANPYATLTHMIEQRWRTIIPAGQVDYFDCTGVTEITPPNYTLPVSKCAFTEDELTGERFEVIRKGANIIATPRLIAALSPADCTIAAADIASVVANPLSNTLTYTLNVARPAYAGNALKGKMMIGTVGGVENCSIVASTNLTIEVAQNTAPTTPLTLMEPSASFPGSTTGGNLPVGKAPGTFRVINCDSVQINGLEIFNVAGITSPGLACAGVGSAAVVQGRYPSCTHNMASGTLQRFNVNWCQGAPRFGGYISMVSGLMDTTTGQITTAMFIGPLELQLFAMVFDGCSPVESLQPYPLGGLNNRNSVTQVRIQNSVIRNTPGITGDGIRPYGGSWSLNNVDISGCGRHGISATLGRGFTILQNVGSTVANGVAAAGSGVNVFDGQFVTADAATNTTNPGAARGLRGTTDTKVGNLAAQTWAAFVAGGKNTYDITAVGAGGATGTGSRLYQ